MNFNIPDEGSNINLSEYALLVSVLLVENHTWRKEASVPSEPSTEYAGPPTDDDNA